MPREPSPPQPVLEYASRRPEKRMSRFEAIGFRYVLGASVSTLIAALWFFSQKSHDYPVTTACGGTFVIAIQVCLLLGFLGVRQYMVGQLLVERRKTVSIVAGVVSTALVFAMPLATSSDVVSAVLTIAPLVGCPLATAFVVLKRSGGAAPLPAARLSER